MDGTAGGQTGDGLRRDGGEDRRRQIALVCAVVDQGLQIRFGEDAASRGYGIEVRVVGRQIVEAGGVDVEQRGHLVDEGPRSARARAIHPLLGRGFEIGDLRVLAAELDDDVGPGNPLIDGAGLGDDLLDEGKTELVGQSQAARPGDRHMQRIVATPDSGQRPLDVAQKIGDRRPDVGVMPAVVGEQRAIEGSIVVQSHGFDRRRPDVQPDTDRSTGAARRRVVPFAHQLTSLPRRNVNRHVSLIHAHHPLCNVVARHADTTFPTARFPESRSRRRSPHQDAAPSPALRSLP
ncbi:hypothetical protein BMIN_1524 [Bifidobacterium minimum]|uniref:Uncharacterized protein n=1 Tax=Bifidobacterium minimum TaxID=1693 RepID=A0A087BK08_9BIFI|nr:hypothetical protein BMIN_1524 [Bifidobacterium minimum]